MNIKKSRSGRIPVYDEAFKNTVIQELLLGKLSMAEAKVRYGIKGDGTLYRWLNQYQKIEDIIKLQPMQSDNNNEPSFQPVSLPVQKEFEEALRMANLKITALETMIDIAESELNIDIRKKSATKQ